MPSLLFGDDSSRRKSSGSRRTRMIAGLVAAVVGLAVVVWGAVRLFGWLSEDGGSSGVVAETSSDATEVQTPYGLGAQTPVGADSGEADDGEPMPMTPEIAGASGNQTPVAAEAPTSPVGTETPPSPVNGAATGGEASASAQVLLAEGRRLEREGKLVAARGQYAKALAAGPNPAQYAEIAGCLASVSERTILGKKLAEGETEAELYEVQSGDYLSTIGRRYAIPYRLVQRINGLPSDSIYAGQKLKVVRGPFRVGVVKSDVVLELWLRDVLVKTYRVAIGRGDSTPAGQYVVLKKLENPAFSPPPSQRGIMKPMPGGDPQNPLGTRWIDFGDHLGIHGTNEPESISQRVSLGCIRMLNSDVEELYDFMTPEMSTVEIVETRP